MRQILTIIVSCIFLTLTASPIRSDLAARNISITEGETESYTAADYIQDGLVAMWDGIENVGWGEHSDTLEQWNDLIGGFALRASDGYVGDFSGGYLNHGVAFYNGAGDPEGRKGMGYYSKWIPIKKIMNGGLFTGEFVCAAYPSKLTSWDYNNSIYLGFGLSNSHTSLGLIMNGNIDIYRGILTSGNTISCLPFIGDGIRTSRTISLDKLNSFVYTYANGIPYSYAGLNASVSWTGSENGPMFFRNTCVGNAYGCSANSWDSPRDSITDIFCIRIYSRVLDAEEIKYNYTIDKARFNL